MTPGGSAGWAAFGRWTLRHRVLVLALAAAASVAAAFALPGVRFAPDVTRLLPDDHPHVRLARVLDERARPARTLWVVLRGAGADDLVPAAAAALRESGFLAEVAATRDDVFGSEVARRRAAPLWFLGDDALARLRERLLPDGLRAAAADARELLADDPIGGREVAVRDPLGLRWLYGDPWQELGLAPGTRHVVLTGGGAAVLRLTGTRDAWDAEFATALMADVERRLAPFSYDVFGAFAVARADASRLRADLRSATIGSVAGIALFLAWSMRGLRGPLLVLVPAAAAILWSIPLADAWFGPLAAIAVGAAAVLCGLGVDFAMHWVSGYRAARAAAAHGDAVALTHARVGPPLCVGMATTAAAFLSLAFGSLAGLRGFGSLLALGLVLSLAATLVLLPVLLGRGAPPRVADRSRLVALADRLRPRTRRAVAAAGVLVAAAGAVLAWAGGLRVNADPDALRPRDDALLATRARIEGELGFATVPVLLLPGDGASVDRLLDGLAALRRDGVVRFWTGVDSAESPRRRARVAALRAELAGWRVEADRAFAAAGFAPAPFAPALDELAVRLAADPDPPTVTGARVVVAYPARRPRGAAWTELGAAVRAACGDGVEVFGTASLIAELERVLRADLLRVVLVAAALTVALVAVSMRSLRAGAVALLPCALGVSATLGAVALAGVELTLASFVAIPFLIGIGVDDGVHLVARFRGGEPGCGATGVAVVRTSVTTAIGFGSLAVASSPGLAGLGVVVAIGVGGCLLASLLVLPAFRPWLRPIGS